MDKRLFCKHFVYKRLLGYPPEAPLVKLDSLCCVDVLVNFLTCVLRLKRYIATSAPQSRQETKICGLAIRLLFLELPRTHSSWVECNLPSIYCSRPPRGVSYVITAPSRARRGSSSGSESWSEWDRDRDHHLESTRQVTYLPPVWDQLLLLA